MANFQTVPVALSFMALAIQATHVQANDAAQLQMDKIVVSATRVEQPLEEVSRSIIVIDRDEIDTLQSQSVAEILSFEPNVLIEGGPRHAYQTINIRGLGGNRVLQTIDGVQQDFESGHRASYFLDPVLLNSVEVIKGPASTLWGSNALGGVVSQTTIDASDLLEADQAVGGLIKTGWNFNNDQSSTTAAVAGQSDDVEWLFSSYYRDSNDIETGNGQAVGNSASRDKGLLAKTTWYVDEEQELTFNLRHADVAGGVPSNGSSNVNNSSVFLVDKDQKNSSASVDYRINSSSLLNAQVLAYWIGVDIDETRVSDGRFDSTKKDTFGLNVNNAAKIGDVRLIYGFDGYHSNFDTARQNVGTPRAGEHDTDIDVFGAFTQVNVPLNAVLELELAGRYDYFSTEAKNLNRDRSDDQFSPSAALIWQTTPALELTLRHDRAFRAPTAEELYSSGAHFCVARFGCNTFVSNPDLKAEDAANTELIARYTATKALYLEGSIFYNRVDDFIEQTVNAPVFGRGGLTSWTTTFSNVNEATLEGFEVEAHYSLTSWDFQLGYGQTRGENRSTNSPLNNIPADTWTATANYKGFGDRVDLGTRLLHAERQDRTSNGRVFGNYTVADLYASWEPRAVDGLQVDLTISNISDENYRRVGSEIDEAGREIMLSTSYKF